MSINWVMLSPSSKPPYTPLQNEQHLFTSSPRVALSISRPSQQSYPGNRSKQQQTNPQEQNFSISSSSGVLHLTNRRLIFLPDVQPSSAGPSTSTSLASSFLVNPFSSSSSASSSTPQSSTSTSPSTSTTSISSFASPILSLHDSHVTAPWFGPNVWTALLQPTPGGGLPIPSTTGVLELKLTFKDGGAFDFHAKYEQLRERVQQVLETARSVGEVDGGGGASNGNGGVNASAVVAGNVHLDQLPAYAERGDGPLLPPVIPVQPQQQQESRQHQGDARRVGENRVNGNASTAGGNDVSSGRSAKEAEARRDEVCTPDEPPPAYEEAQLAGLQEEMERRRRDGENEDQDDLPPQ